MHSRHKLIIGEEGQAKLEKSAVAVVGMGALGTVAAELLARAGVGTLLLIDRDIVEESNLQRQTLYSFDDVGRSKAAAAKERLEKIAPHARIISHAIHLNAKNINTLDDMGLTLDCTDNQQTRFVINDFCRKEKKRWVYGAAIKTSGYVMPILPEGPCLRCFMKEADLETCETAGVLNTITASIAALQVQTALELLLGKEVKSLLYHYDIDAKQFKTLTVRKEPGCKTCAGQFEYLVPKEESTLIQFCGSGRYQIAGKEKDMRQLKERLARIGEVKEDGTTLQFRNMVLFADGRALINADSEEEALSAYAKWVGN